MNSIFLLQKKALRICTNSSFLAHTDPLFYQLNVLKVNDINSFQTAIFMFRYTKNSLPQTFNDYFLYNKNVHSYPTRARNDIHLNNPRILLAHKSLRHHGPDVWNALPNYLKQFTSFLKPFKRKLKRIMINKYCPSTVQANQ